MLFLHSRGFKVSKPEKNVHGSYLIYAKISGDEGITRERERERERESVQVQVQVHIFYSIRPYICDEN